MDGRSRPNSASSSRTLGEGHLSSGPSRALRPITPASDPCDDPALLAPADNNSTAFAETDTSDAYAVSVALVAAAGGSDDVRASVSMVEPILTEAGENQFKDFTEMEENDIGAHVLTLNVPQS